MNKEDVKKAFMNHSYNKMKKTNEQGLYVNTSDIPRVEYNNSKNDESIVNITKTLKDYTLKTDIEINELKEINNTLQNNIIEINMILALLKNDVKALKK